MNSYWIFVFMFSIIECRVIFQAGWIRFQLIDNLTMQNSYAEESTPAWPYKAYN